MGKTRLAVECALRASRAFPDGVYFVSLADRPPNAQAIAEAIGEVLKVERAGSLPDLLPALHEKTLLLTLDNFESVHCQETQAFLRDLINQTDRVCLLLTSRESAHLPPIEKIISVNGLTDEQATELFIARARLQPDRDQWEPKTEAAQEALRYILTQTNCIPLAIELLAAWMGEREIGQIATELKANPLPALPEDYVPGDDAERHQSLKHCFDYSYDRLRDALRRGFALLSLFADTFDAAGVESACGLPNAQAVLDQMTRKALLIRTPDGDNACRYGMLHEARAYAATLLTALPDPAETIPQRFIAHYVQLIRNNDDWNDLKKLAVLDREWLNAIAAAELADARNDAVSVCEIASGLCNFLELRGLWTEWEWLMTWAVAAAQRTGDREREGRALNNLGNAYQLQSRYEEAIYCSQEALAIFQERQDREREGKALNNLGIVYREQGLYDEAIACCEQALTLFQERRDSVGEGQTRINLGGAYFMQGRYAQAIACFEQSLTIKKGQQDRIGEGHILHNLGNIYWWQNRWQAAEKCYQDCLQIWREYGDRVGEGKTLYSIALLYESQDELAQAVTLAKQACAILETTQDAKGAANVRKWLGRTRTSEPAS